MKRLLSALLAIVLTLFMVSCFSVGSDVPSYGDSSSEIENSGMPSDNDASSNGDSSQTSSSMDRDNLGENELPFVPKK